MKRSIKRLPKRTPEEGWAFGARYTFQSDLDILVICNNHRAYSAEELQVLDAKTYYEEMARKEEQGLL